MHEAIGSLNRFRWHLALAAACCLLALGGGPASAAEPSVNVAVRQDGEAFIIDATVDAPVAQDIAWGVLTDFDHMASIVGNLTSSKVTSRDGNTWIVNQEGVAKFGLLSFSFTSERQIRLEPMKRILARNISGTVKRMESEANIAAVDQGVQIKYRAETVPDSVLARMFGASFIRHEVREQFLAMTREMVRRAPRAEPERGAAEAAAR